MDHKEPALLCSNSFYVLQFIVDELKSAVVGLLTVSLDHFSKVGVLAF